MKILIGILVLLGIGAYFYFSPSYMLSLEAQRAFDRQDYQASFDLAKEALALDAYNKMAFGIHSQSKQRLNILHFLSHAKALHEDATKLLNKRTLTPQELLQLKWIYEEFEQAYAGLTFVNKFTPNERKEADIYLHWFEQLQIQLSQALKHSQKK